MSIKIKNLMISGDYYKVLQLTNGTTDPEDLIYRISSLRILGNYQEAIKEYYNSRNIVENYDLISSAKNLLFCLIYISDEPNLYKEIEYFKSYKYINQETEEFVRGIDNFVSKCKKFREDHETNDDVMSYETLKNLLISNSEVDESYGIKKLIEMNKKGIIYEKCYFDYFSKKTDFTLNFSMMLYLSSLAKYDGNITFKKDGKYFTIKPIDLNEYIEKIFPVVIMKIKEMNSEEKNISLAQYSSILINPLFFYLLPEKIADNDVDNLVAASLIIGASIFKINLENDSFFKKLKVNETYVDKFLKIYEKIKYSL
ncbi:MAG: hypothetical protein WCR97_01530 [Bacilli bacterium]